MPLSTGLRHLLFPRGQPAHPRRARQAGAAVEDPAQRQSGRRPLRSRLQEQRLTLLIVISTA